jgi:hypothetical protein
MEISVSIFMIKTMERRDCTESWAMGKERRNINVGKYQEFLGRQISM